MVSVIIPVYNEKKVISDCLSSLAIQSYPDFEIIVVDDGSTDNSELRIKNLRYHKQKHQGPGKARNFGAKYAKGDILVFIDADMTFDQDFIKYLIQPIVENKSKGTFTKEEYVSNWDNVWARCWNYNEGLATSRRISPDYPTRSPVFRAILKSEFIKVKGFEENIGFTDDWTLSRKLGYKSTPADKAICYHANPETLSNVYRQARWIGKNEFISGLNWKRIVNLLRFNPLIQAFRAVFVSVKNKEWLFMVFSLYYYSGITVSIFLSFFHEAKYK
ncbi:glycosyltransferase [Candidatus Microgenomates bacterium]|nr:glycosyltransferase [Candidatus Microgenomates bacterium]